MVVMMFQMVEQQQKAMLAARYAVRTAVVAVVW